MAAKKFTRGTRLPKNLEVETFCGYIEAERSRLMDAEAVLDCLLRAIDDDVRLDASGPSYPNVVRIARELVHSAIDRLDSVKVRAVIARGVSAEMSAEQGKYRGVREEPVGYVH